MGGNTDAVIAFNIQADVIGGERLDECSMAMSGGGHFGNLTIWDKADRLNCDSFVDEITRRDLEGIHPFVRNTQHTQRCLEMSLTTGLTRVIAGLESDKSDTFIATR